MKRKFSIRFDNAPDHALDYLLGIMEDTRTVTLTMAEKLTGAELHWQYREGWNTIGALLSHITALEHYFRIVYVEKRELTKEENDRWEPSLDMGKHLPQLITGQPAEQYIADLKTSGELMSGAVKKLTFDDLSEKINDYDPEAGCNLAWVLFHMVEDEIYHRGQISLIKKLYGAQHS